MKIFFLGLIGLLGYSIYAASGGAIVAGQIIKNAEFSGFSLGFSEGKILLKLKLTVTNVSKNSLKIQGLKAYIQALGSTIATIEPSASVLAGYVIQPEGQTTIEIPVNIPLVGGALTAAQIGSVKALNASGYIDIETIPRIEIANYSIQVDGQKILDEAKNAVSTASELVNEARLKIVKTSLTDYKKQFPKNTVTVWVDENTWTQTLNTYFFLVRWPDTELVKYFYTAYKVKATGGLTEVAPASIDQKTFKKIEV